MTKTAIVYQVDYTNQYGEQSIRADFTLEQASQMVLRLCEGTAWGNVRSVVITPTERMVDPRSIEEIEAEVIV